ncbi:hypothetical protein ACS74B_002088 [Enterococcus faecalis]
MKNEQACKELRKSNNVFKQFLKYQLLQIVVLYSVANLVFLFFPEALFGTFKIVLLFIWIGFPLLPCILIEQRFIKRNLVFLKEIFLEPVVEKEKLYFRFIEGEVSMDLEMLSKHRDQIVVGVDYVFIYFSELQLHLPVQKEEIMKEAQWRDLIDSPKEKQNRVKTLKVQRKDKNLSYNFRYVTEVATSDVAVLLTKFWCICFCLTIYWIALLAFFLPILLPTGQKVFIVLLLAINGGYSWFLSLSNKRRCDVLLGSPTFSEPFPTFQIQDDFLVYQLGGKSGTFALSKISLVNERAANVFSVKLGKIYFYGSDFPSKLPWGDSRWEISHKKGHLFSNRNLILVNFMLVVAYCVFFQLILSLF